VAPAAAQAGTDGVCIACHDERQWAVDKGDIKIGSMLHPRALDKNDAASLAAHKMPLADAPGTRPAQADAKPQQLIACRTCHDPHADPVAPSLLRVSAGQKPQDLCAGCHQDVTALAHSPHRLDNPKIAALRTGEGPAPTCSPCHAVHAVQTSQRELLWTAAVSKQSTVDVDQHCLGCHGVGGSAKQPQLFQHPKAAFASLVYTAKPGQPAPQTDLAKLFSCATCHYTHGSEIPGIQQLAAQGAGPVLEAAARPMVRSGVAETYCRNCHGPDAPRVFLYYHQPERRAIVGFMAHPL
jgi:predicted CXXCH cytochrome family protein